MSSKDLFSLEDEEFSASDLEIEKGRSDVISAKSKRSAAEALSDEDDSGSDAEGDSDAGEGDDEGAEKAGTVKPLSKEEAEAKIQELKRTGVVYLSRIPPYMKPIKLRQILARFGEVNRIFLSPEDAKAHQKRVRAGGNKKKKYSEGWAEFVNKSEAKLAAETLNGNNIGGRKGSFYYDDILNIKYLKHFKWADLTEAIALEAQERQEKLKAEIAQATRENKIFIENVERKAMIDNIAAKKGTKKTTVHREFTQRPSAKKPATAKSKEGDIGSILSKVF